MKSERIAFLQKSCLKSLLPLAGALFYYAFYFLSGDHLLDQDAYYHIKIAEITWEKGWIWKLPQMAHSIMSDRFVHTHFLFEVLQIPFLWILPTPVLAAKTAHLLFAFFAVVALDHLLRTFAVAQRWFWILFYLLASPIFTGRVFFGRGFPLFLGLLFLFITLYHRRKLWPTAITGAIAVWSYPGFPLFIAFILIYELTFFFDKLQLDWRRPAFALGGILFALIVHPSFPAQFNGYWIEILGRFLHPGGLEPTAEWQDPDSRIIYVGLFIPTILVVLSFLRGNNRQGNQAVPGDGIVSRTLLALVLILTMASFAAIRPIEHLFPIMVLYLALYPWSEFGRRPYRVGIVVLFLIMVLWGAPQIRRRFRGQHKRTDPVYYFQTADWLKQNTLPNSLVMLPWDNFPQFFFRNTHNRFLNGMNPIYSYAANPERHSLVRSFFDGSASNFYLIPAAIKADYAVLKITKTHGRTIETLFKMKQKDGYVQEVYRDPEFIVFQFDRRALVKTKRKQTASP